jgi:hypothetical protein
MTPIRETIARALFATRFSAEWETDRWARARAMCRDEADDVLRALEEAGCVVVRKDEFFASRGREPCAMELEWARQQAQDLDLP